MPAITTPIPCRRPELVARPFEGNGSYLVRDRRAGESFTLGPEEYFLLAQLDGTRNAHDLRAAFADRFGEPLSEDELDDFLHLARQRGFLQEERDKDARPDGTRSRPVRPWEMATPQEVRRNTAPRIPVRRLISLFLGAVASVLQWLADLLEGAVGWIRSVKLIHCDFVPRPDDIFIVTYPRSGTTWMQMILYQLTTDGSMDFPHIYEYCPWFEESSRSADGFEGRPSPRLFKSHLSYRRIPKGPCKYIYIARNGKDVAVSYFHFSRSHLGFRGTFDAFFDRFLRGRVKGGSWFKHVKGWWDHRNDANVLFLYYEELLHDLETCVRRIIAFCDLDVDPARLPAILERCSFTFMKAHESQFDPQRGVLWEQGIQWNAFIRQGRAGAWKDTLSPQQASWFERVFQKELGSTEIDLGDGAVGITNTEEVHHGTAS
jgi:hypothetical protein